MALVLVLGALWLVGVPAMRRRIRSRRRADAVSPAARVLVYWQEANDVLAQAGAGRRPHETFREHAEACDINELLQRQQQLEVFYKIDLAGVLHFMLLLNGAQRQMNAKIQHENRTFSYPIIDMREMDSEVLMQSPAIEDNLLAILCRLNDEREARDAHAELAAESFAFLLHWDGAAWRPVPIAAWLP